MATQAQVEAFRRRIKLTAGDDTLIAECIDAAWSTVNLELGFEFADYPLTASARYVYGWGTPYLALPPHQAGSVTSVLWGTSTVTGWSELEDGSLYVPTTGWWPYSYNAYSLTGWAMGAYTVTAKWGVGPASEAVEEVAVEVAINLFKERDKGMFSDIVGVEGSGGIAVGYAHAFTNRQQRVLDLVKAKYSQGVLVA